MSSLRLDMKEESTQAVEFLDGLGVVPAGAKRTAEQVAPECEAHGF